MTRLARWSAPDAGQVCLVDVRDPGEFKDGRVPQAVNVRPDTGQEKEGPRRRLPPTRPRGGHVGIRTRTGSQAPS
ncbi:MAG: rhodanese-like domain-containing protein [Planctomycetota bacterium]